MPQAKIISHEGNGLYFIELQLDWSILDRKIADLSSIISALAPQLAAAEAAYNTLKTQFDILVGLQEEAVNELIDINHDEFSTEEEKKAARDKAVLATENADKKRPELKIAFDKWQILLAKSKSAQNQKDRYVANPRTNPIAQAQAVDKVDGSTPAVLSGTYPVIPINTMIHVYQLAREAEAPKWIIPPALPHNETTMPSLALPITLPSAISGKLISQELLHSGAVFWDSCMLPGYQRWDPHVRKGVITAIAGSNFTVRLSPLLNSVDLAMQGPEDTFVFPVDYFCGPSAFLVNDQVIVKITEWNNNIPTGTVIGFAGTARECIYGTVYPPIPWITVTHKFQNNVLYNQFSSIYMEKSPATSDISEPPLTGFDVYADVFGQYEYWDFKIKSQWTLSLLRNMDDTATLAADTFLNFVLGYFSGNIPAMILKSSETVVSTTGPWRLDGDKIYFVSTGGLYISGAVVQRTPEFDPPPALNTQFTMNYNNPDPYTGGAFPPGTGSATYDLDSTFTSGAFHWAVFEKI